MEDTSSNTNMVVGITALSPCMLKALSCPLCLVPRALTLHSAQNHGDSISPPGEYGQGIPPHFTFCGKCTDKSSTWQKELHHLLSEYTYGCISAEGGPGISQPAFR